MHLLNQALFFLVVIAIAGSDLLVGTIIFLLFLYAFWPFVLFIRDLILVLIIMFAICLGAVIFKIKNRHWPELRYPLTEAIERVLNQRY